MITYPVRASGDGTERIVDAAGQVLGTVEIVAAIDDAGRAKDAVYLERNQVVAALARLFPSGVARTAIDGWEPEWHGCVYIDLPTGQVSWHYHDSHAHLFAGMPPYAKPWDGHDTAEKYRRVAALANQPQARPHREAEYVPGRGTWGELT